MIFGVNRKKLTWQYKDYKKFKKRYGRYPNLKNPATFSEKLLYRKRHHVNNSYCTMLADKLAVREYINSTIGNKHLVPILKVFDNTNSITSDISKYAGHVLKANHGSGMVFLIPEKLDLNDANTVQELASGWLKTDYSYKGESQYEKIPRKVFVEQFLGNSRKLAVNYYFHLFRQKDNSYKYLLQVYDNSPDNNSLAYFLNSLSDKYFGETDVDMDSKKENLSLALENSKKLLGKLEYARIDWYIIDNQLFFSEITLTHLSGHLNHTPLELEKIMGNFWDLSLSPFNK